MENITITPSIIYVDPILLLEDTDKKYEEPYKEDMAILNPENINQETDKETSNEKEKSDIDERDPNLENKAINEAYKENNKVEDKTDEFKTEEPKTIKTNVKETKKINSAFKALYPDAVEYMKIIKAIMVINNEATFNLNHDGLSLRVIDPSNVTMIDLVIPKSAFQEYYVDKNNDSKYCLDLEDMLKLVKVKKDDCIEIKRTDGNNEKLTVNVIGKFNKKYLMPNLGPSNNEMPLPKLTYDVNIKLGSADLLELLENFNAEQIRIEAFNDKLVFSNKDEMGETSIPIEKRHDCIYDFTVKTESKALYSISFIKPIIKECKNLNDIMTLKFSMDRPIMFSVTLKNKVKIEYYLAPRIE